MRGHGPITIQMTGVRAGNTPTLPPQKRGAAETPEEMRFGADAANAEKAEQARLAPSAGFANGKGPTAIFVKESRRPRRPACD
jgi:hypothetical protein